MIWIVSIFSAYGQYARGYFRYVTDLMIADYPMTVLFPKRFRHVPDRT